MQNIKKLGGLVLGLVILALTTICLTEMMSSDTTAQTFLTNGSPSVRIGGIAGPRAVGDWAFNSAQIIPSQQTGTNGLAAWDLTGTNQATMIGTNGQFSFQSGGSNVTAVLNTNIIVTNANNTTVTLKFRNGLLVFP